MNGRGAGFLQLMVLTCMCAVEFCKEFHPSHLNFTINQY